MMYRCKCHISFIIISKKCKNANAEAMGGQKSIKRCKTIFEQPLTIATAGGFKRGHRSIFWTYTRQTSMLRDVQIIAQNIKY